MIESSLKKQAFIGLIIALVGLALSVVSYAYMVQAVELMAVFGYSNDLLPPCVVGITLGSVAVLTIVGATIFVVKAVEKYVEQRKNGARSKVCIALIIASFVVIASVLMLTFSSVFGCIGLLG